MNTQITFVLDSSGSMNSIADDTRGGFNAFLDDQRGEAGTATVTLYDFNTTVDRVYEGYPVTDAPELDDENYKPGGQTALYDAIARAVDETAKNISGIDPVERPDKVIIVVLTDGKENASETPQEAVRGRVEHRQEADDWEFLFIGANQDAVLTAERMGIERERSLTMAHDGEGTRDAYRSTSETISEARSNGTMSGFDEADRQRQERPGN
ncbi:von Willebrand factor type A domain-containing protein [Halopelagius inordinatus]|uniref:von Willebrand factor type A domain-containing protein n=1 Tax=Halopelagius inordinatus TaxID=553467 RepID=A0A1I2M852_9EURY|nr:vWA domain-containing protein [Halopelagius inordinatus]SFF87642.1 von Willebrand factor type A domain-containing protein [Halopelagius inordinatus]